MAKGLTLQRNNRMQPRLIAAAVAACFASASVALPTAPNVVSGQATFNAQGKSLTITNTPGAIINWGGFSIRADELARFVQQSGSSSVLNRVVGQDPSQILGQLQSNGRVFLLNPNGIVFGAGAQIDVAGLVASTLHLSDADFLAGRMRFREQVGAGGIVNQGEIRTPSGGQVFLVAPRVENSGLITTPGGDIVLAAGKSVEIVDPANPSVRVEVSAPENEALNVGKLVASGGRITMAGSLLRVSGRVSADAAVVEDGKVVFRRTASPAATDVAGTVKLQASQSLTVESGAAITADGPVAGKVELHSTGDLTLQLESKVSASGAVGGAVSAQATTGMLLSEGTVQVTGSDGPGGLIRLQGDRVALLNRSRTDASGADGGGIVLVGGGFQGNDAGTQNAKRTVVMPGAVVAADATREGDGGQVVVWSDEATRYYGAISARGAGEGKGGSVEVSGKQHLAFAGNVDVSAPSGRSGNLLLDPLNITLSTAAGANIAGFTPPGDLKELFTDDAGLASTFNVSANGSFAGIAPGSNITLQATNNITVANNFNVATATGGNTNINVTLQANNTIAVNATIVTAGNGSITLIADNDQNGTGAITRTAAGTLNTGAGGTITLSAGTGVNAAVSSPSVTVSNANSGVVAVTNANAGGSVSFGNVVASSLSVTTSNGAVTQSGTMNVSAGTATFNLGTAGDVTLGNAANDFGTVAFTSARNVAVSDKNAIILGATTLAGNLSVTTANSAITQSGALVVPGAANFQAGTGNVTLATATNNFNVVDVTAQVASLTDANALTLGNVSTTGNLTVGSGTGGLNQTAGGTVTVGGTASFTAGTGNSITLSNATNNFNVVRVVSGNNVVLRDVDAMSFGGGASTVSGNLTVTTGGALTQSSSLSVATAGRVATFNTGTADLTLGNTANAFGNVAIVSAGNATLYEAGGFDLAATTVGNNLTVTSTGAITDSGNIVVAGRLTVETRNNTVQNITLDSAGNNFGSVSARTLNGAGAAAVAGTITLREASAMDVALLTTTGAANLTAAGAITQSGAIRVDGTLTANAGLGNDITLNQATNNFGTVTIVQARDVSLADANAIVLGAMTLAGNLAVSTNNGAITQSGALVVPGTANFQAGTANITLATATNNFNVVEAAGQAVSLRDTNAMTLGNVSATGTLTLVSVGALNQTAGGTVSAVGNATFNAGAANDITLVNATNNFTTLQVVSGNNVQLTDMNGFNFGVGTSAVSGTLAVTANGAVAQSSALTVVGAASFNVGAGNNLTLNQAANNFTTVSVAQANNVTLFDTNAIALGNVSTTGNLTVSAAGLLNQASGSALTVGGTANLGAGAGNNITLTNAGNDFGGVRIASGLNVQLRDATGFDFRGGASTANGALTVAAGGAVTQNSSLAVTGLATFNTGTADLTLGNTANAFANVSIVSAGNATLYEAGGFDLAATTVSNNLTVTSTGAITDSGNIVVAGRLTVETRNNTAQNITLDSAGNNFGSVSARTLNGAGAAAVAGTITLRENSAMDLGRIETSGALNITALGAVTQAAGSNVVAGGTATFNAGTNALTLGNATNNFGTVAITQAGNATLVDRNAITLNASNVPGSLDVTATNNTLTVAGNISTAAANGAITFNAGTGTYVQNANVDVAAGSGNITVTANTLTVNTNTGNNALLTSGTLSVRPGAVGQAMTVAGTGGFDVTAAELNAILPGLNNAGGSLVVGRADSTAALTIGAAHNFGVGSRVTLAAGSITDANTTNRTLTATDLTLYANSGNIGGAGNNAIDVAASNLVVGANNQSAFVRSATGLNFGPSTSNLGSGSLVATAANGAITQSGALTVGGTANFTTNNSALTLTNASNDFASVRVSSVGNTSIRDQNALAIAGANVNGTLSLTTAGDLTQTGAITATGTTTLNAGAGGNITLTNTGNNFASVLVPSANDVSLYDASAIDLVAFSVNGAITVQGVGNVSLSGVLTAAGAGNAIVLAAGGNFVNNAGASALSAANGRWLVYSTDPAANTFGGLASGNNPLWSKTYAANPPASISLAGNRYLFSVGRTLTVTGTDVAKTYGDDLIGQMAQSYAVSGLNTNTYGGALLADTQAAVLAGAPDIASTGAAASTAVAGSPYAMTLGAGTLSSPTGYAISYGAAGQLTVTRAPLTIGVQEALRLEGQSNPAFSATYSGFRNGEGTPVLQGALQFATTAGPNSVPGSYSVTPSGYSAANYTITYVPGTLRVLSTIGGDPLRDSYIARRGLADQGQLEFRGAVPASIPTFVLAEADLPFEELLRRLPATAAGPDGNRPRKLRDPNCGTGLPLASLRCRSVDDG